MERHRPVESDQRFRRAIDKYIAEFAIKNEISRADLFKPDRCEMGVPQRRLRHKSLPPTYRVSYSQNSAAESYDNEQDWRKCRISFWNVTPIGIILTTSLQDVKFRIYSVSNEFYKTGMRNGGSQLLLDRLCLASEKELTLIHARLLGAGLIALGTFSFSGSAARPSDLH